LQKSLENFLRNIQSAQAFPHTSQNAHQSNIAILEVIAVPLPSTDNAKQSLTIRLLLPLQFLQKLLENSQKQTIPHHQAIASTSILAKITQ